MYLKQYLVVSVTFYLIWAHKLHSLSLNIVYSYAGPSGNRPIWLGRLECTSNSNAVGGCGRLDPAIGSTVHCRDHGLNNANDAAVNCNRTSPFSKGKTLLIELFVVMLHDQTCCLERDLLETTILFLC